MKSPQLLTKTVVLSVFIFLLSGFVAYRSGAFAKLLAGKQTNIPRTIESNTAFTYQVDTIPKADSPRPVRTIMSSSKSIVMPDNYEYTYKDRELKKKLKKKKMDTAVQKRPIMFSGSKSGPVITPRILPDTPKKNQ